MTSIPPVDIVLGMDADVIVIGGGVLGTSVAYHLGNLGQRVLLLEREPLLGVHASGRNAGMFRKLYRHPQLTDWADRSAHGWPRGVREQCYRQTGSLIVGRSAPSHHRELFSELSVKTASGTAPGVFTATDGLLDSPGYLEALRSLLPRERVTVRCRTEVRAAYPLGGHQGWELEVHSLQNGDNHTHRNFRAPWIVNAAGAWINRFLAPSTTIEAAPFARHLFLVEGWQHGFMPSGVDHLAREISAPGYYWDEREGWYLRQWDDDARLVSICDRIAAEPESFVPPPNLTESLAQTLLKALPDHAAHLAVRRHWHCFRTYVQDQLPAWGEDIRAPGLFWLGAFGGFGMSTSFAAAEDAARFLVGQAPHRHPDFDPIRATEATPRLRHGAPL